MKNLLITILALATFGTFAQTANNEDINKELKSLNEKIKTLETKNVKQNSEIIVINKKLSDFEKITDSLKKQIEKNKNAINQKSEELGLKITTTEEIANQKFQEVDNSLSKRTLWAIIGVLFAVIISGIVYLLLRKKQKSDKTDLIEKLTNTKTSIEENLIIEFGKQTELMGKLVETLRATSQNATSQNVKTDNYPKEPDHSLALKVASEINIIERNINLMDAGTKGLKQLTRSVEKLKDNLMANGYEIPQLLGKQFHEGMKVIVTSSIPDENLEKGSEIITKILIPQVNYNGKMIQAAQIEVTVGY